MSNSKKSKASKSARQRKNSRLNQHRQTGKTLQPPFRQIPNVVPQPWARNSLPDMLWILALITDRGEEGLKIAAELLDRVEVSLPPQDPEATLGPRPPLTGTLTSFALVPEAARAEALAGLVADGLYDEAFPWVFVRGMQKYKDVPGAWLLEGWKGREQIIPADRPERFLRRVVGEAAHGQAQHSTWAKFLALRAYFKAGRIHMAPGVGDEWLGTLPRYPGGLTEEERRITEPSIRATYMAISGAHVADGQADPAIEWAKTFWRQNWSLYSCEREQHEELTVPIRAENESSIKEVAAEWKAELDALTERFEKCADETDPDLYMPDRYEVITGITHRMLRLCSTLVGYPPLWTMEHGSPTLRSLVEARIVMRWLVLRDDPDLFVKFKDYGRGRLKLLKLHLEEYRDSFDEDAPEGLDQQIEYLDALVNQDVMEEFQDISIQGNFAGVDTRKMADEVGMNAEYHFVFAPTSSAVHGEWMSLDQYVLTTCRNPLHLRHRIREESAITHLGPDLVDVMLRSLTSLVEDYEAALIQEEPA